MKVYQFLNAMLYGMSTVEKAVIHIPEQNFECLYPDYVLKCPTDIGYQDEFPSLRLPFRSFSVQGSVLHVYAKG